MFEGIDLNKAMEEVQKMASQAKEDGNSNIFTASSGGGMVKISINGNSEVIDLSIDDSLLDDKDSLQVLLMSSLNDVLKQSENNKKDLAMKMMSGFGSFNKQ